LESGNLKVNPQYQSQMESMVEQQSLGKPHVAHRFLLEDENGEELKRWWRKASNTARGSWRKGCWTI
jgi:hypothetical protein